MNNKTNDGQQNQSGGLLTLTGLWEKQNASGGTYYVGALGGAKVLLLANTRKGDDENAPDWNLCVAPRTPKPAVGSGTSGNYPPRRPPAR